MNKFYKMTEQDGEISIWEQQDPALTWKPKIRCVYDPHNIYSDYKRWRNDDGDAPLEMLASEMSKSRADEIMG